MNKVVKNASEALYGIRDGMTLMVGGFGLSGLPENTIAALAASEVCPIDDNRSSKEYRLEMVQVLLKRSLQAIMEKEGHQ